MIRRAMGIFVFILLVITGILFTWLTQLVEVSSTYVLIALLLGVMIGNIGTHIEYGLKEK